MTVDEWVETYRQALPERLRPRRGSERVLLAAYDAHAGGWAPHQLAALVARDDYTTAKNPPVIALIRLEEYAIEPPRGGTRLPRSKRHHPNGCTVCHSWMTCEDPVLPQHRIQDAWVHERFALIADLMNYPDMSEDEREQHMIALAADQKARPLVSTA